MNCPKHVEFYSKNKFEKLVQLVGFIIRSFVSSYRCLCSPILLHFSKTEPVTFHVLVLNSLHGFFYRIITNFKMLINSFHLRNNYTKRDTHSLETVLYLMWSKCDWDKLFSELFRFILSALFHKFSTCIHSSYHLSYMSIILGIDASLVSTLRGALEGNLHN